jgi:type IV secretion system protein VirB6
MSCIGPPTGSGFLAATLANLDCQAQTIGAAGYQSLASAGSPLSLALAVLLSVFVAIIGIRFLTGKPLSLEEWVSGILKVGFVLALAGSWPTYQAIVYDVVLKAPAEVSSSIGQASALPGSDGGLMMRLQAVDNGILALTDVGSGRLDIASRRPTDAIAPPLADDTALGWGKTLFVGSIIGGFGLLRLGGGVFLALAPLFASFLLFDAARFLFFGWLRSLIAVAIGSIGQALVLGVQLAIMEPWLSQVLALRTARIATLSAPFELLALSLAFTVTMFGMLFLAIRISFASPNLFKMQSVLENIPQALFRHSTGTATTSFSSNDNLGERTRAQEIAQSLRQSAHRDAVVPAVTAHSVGTASRTDLGRVGRETVASEQTPPLGRSYPSPSRRVSKHTLNRKPAL